MRVVSVNINMLVLVIIKICFKVMLSWVESSKFVN